MVFVWKEAEAQEEKGEAESAGPGGREEARPEREAEARRGGRPRNKTVSCLGKLVLYR